MIILFRNKTAGEFFQFFIDRFHQHQQAPAAVRIVEDAFLHDIGLFDQKPKQSRTLPL